MAERFEDLRAWQTARSLTNQVYALSGKEEFGNDWALKDQIRRAAISVMSNISEGFESRTRPRFIDFLGRAKASAGEFRSQLYVAHDQGYVDDKKFEAISDRADRASRQLYHLIQHLEKNNGSGRVQEIPEEYVTN
ncbi:four helix bundle protein [Salinibacter ruber]|uniref:four helix bundle protein n=1 Tax=Salinibacter ruber TaxID=146919 RepID=UPI0021680F8D|nr:four helix bundle protein [Salinibacter ruber]MCS3697438.1 four helix bundle protein [Salinibacter ruber]